MRKDIAMSRTHATLRLLQTTLLAAAFVIAFSAAALQAKEKEEVPPDWKKDGKWSALTQYIGTYQYDKILDDKNVKDMLGVMLKGHDLDLKQEFNVKTSVGFENDCLILKGNRQNAASTNSSYMEVCVSNGSINLAVQDSPNITLFTALPEYKFMSDGMRGWIFFRNNGYKVAIDKPDNVQMIVTAP